MALLDGKTHQEYYQGNDLGNYQFTSLEDIINQFMVVYTGENKLIPKASRIDVAFHAQRALAELSFDTFKSIKSQEIDVGNTLLMPLPHDYVNYTKLSRVDNVGIKHPLYPTKHTSNPFEIEQNDGGLRSYQFLSGDEVIINNDFNDVGADQGGLGGDEAENWNRISASIFGGNYGSGVGILDGKVMWSYSTHSGYGSTGWGKTSLLYQQLDATDLQVVDISADGVTRDIIYANTSDNTNTGTAVGTIRFGLTTHNPALITNLNNHVTYTYPTTSTYSPGITFEQSPFFSPDFFDIGYLEWTGNDTSTKTIENLNLQAHDTLYIVALSFAEATTALESGFVLKPDALTASPVGSITSSNINSLDNLSLTNSHASVYLSRASGSNKSSTWNNYKSITPSENNNNNYEDDTYWPMDGERYGLEPSHAQINGSFYIDEILGNIHFSSNISGKTVILDYISDSLGTDGEMQVHKFAEDAMYRCIAHAIISASSYGQQLVPRLTKEKFAAIRKAKLRLSNIKLEELTQILRGKSKQIKH